MGPTLHSLIALQHVENKLRAFKARLTRCQHAILAQENQLRTLQNQLEAKQQEIKMTRMEIDRLELELKTRDEHIAKLRNALNLARNNKEYAALLTELNTTKADDAKLENQVLELMKAVEADQAACLTIQQQIDAQKTKVEQVRQENAAKIAELQRDIEQIQAEWQQAADNVPAAALAIFKRLAETYNGEAMAQIEQACEKSKTYSCGGCFMGIPAEVVNILTAKDEIIRCSNCTRILYLQNHQ